MSLVKYLKHARNLDGNWSELNIMSSSSRLQVGRAESNYRVSKTKWMWMAFALESGAIRIQVSRPRAENELTITAQQSKASRGARYRLHCASQVEERKSCCQQLPNTNQLGASLLVLVLLATLHSTQPQAQSDHNSQHYTTSTSLQCSVQTDHSVVLWLVRTSSNQ